METPYNILEYILPQHSHLCFSRLKLDKPLIKALHGTETTLGYHFRFSCVDLLVKPEKTTSSSELVRQCSCLLLFSYLAFEYLRWDTMEYFFQACPYRTFHTEIHFLFPVSRSEGGELLNLHRLSVCSHQITQKVFARI